MRVLRDARAGVDVDQALPFEEVAPGLLDPALDEGVGDGPGDQEGDVARVGGIAGEGA